MEENPLGWSVEDGGDDDWDDSELLKAFDRSIEKYQLGKKKGSNTKTNFQQVNRNKSNTKNTREISKTINKKRKLTQDEKYNTKSRNYSSIKHDNQKLQPNENTTQNQGLLQKKNDQHFKKNTDQYAHKKEKNTFLIESDEIEPTTKLQSHFYDEKQEQEESELSSSIESDDEMDAANIRFAQFIQIGEQKQQEMVEKKKKVIKGDNENSSTPPQVLQSQENGNGTNIQYQINSETTDKLSSLHIQLPISTHGKPLKEKNQTNSSSSPNSVQMNNSNQQHDFLLMPQHLFQQSIVIPGNEEGTDSFILALEQEAFNDMLCAWYKSGYYAGRYWAVKEFNRSIKK